MLRVAASLIAKVVAPGDCARAVGSAALVSALALGAAPALAQSALLIETAIQVEKVETGADGRPKTVLGPANAVKPDDVLLFSTTYRNRGTQSATGAVIASPVPAGVAFVSIEGDGEVSVDGRLFGALGDLKMAGTDGPRAAVADDVRVVRWRVPTSIAPGAAGVVRYRGKLR